MRGARSALLLAAFGGALLCPVRALAQDGGFYLGGALGQSTFPDWCKTTAVLLACDDQDTAWKVFGGYQFNRYLAVEAAYIDWGTITGTLAGPPPRDVSLSQTTIGLSAVGSLPLGERLAVFGKIGRVKLEQETPASASGTFTRKITDTLYGLGVRFRLAPNWLARAEWEQTDEIEARMLSIGVEFRF